MARFRVLACKGAQEHRTAPRSHYCKNFAECKPTIEDGSTIVQKKSFFAPGSGLSSIYSKCELDINVFKRFCVDGKE